MTLGRIKPKTIAVPYDIPIIDAVEEEILNLTEEVDEYKTDPEFYFDTLTAIEELLLGKGLVP